MYIKQILIIIMTFIYIHVHCIHSNNKNPSYLILKSNVVTRACVGIHLVYHKKIKQYQLRNVKCFNFCWPRFIHKNEFFSLKRTVWRQSWNGFSIAEIPVIFFIFGVWGFVQILIIAWFSPSLLHNISKYAIVTRCGFLAN